MTLAEQGVQFGAFTPITPGGDQLEAINILEQSINRRLDVVNNFRKWGAPSGDFAQAKKALQQSSSQGRVPMVTWEPMLPDSSMGPYTLASIAAGDHDEYLNTWVEGLRKWPTPVYIRLKHEMNGDWYPWCGKPKTYVAAWRHVASLFADLDHVKFVWCVNTDDQPSGNRLEEYYPGSDLVDILGIDGYNCYGGWRSFYEIIKPAYDRVAALDPDKPIWVCETATGEAEPRVARSAGHTKAEWIAGMFAASRMPRITTILWLDSPNPRSYDWRVATTVEARAELTRQLRKAKGWVAPPGPYVPPVPSGVVAQADGAGAVLVSWRSVPSFVREYRVYVDEKVYVLPKTTTKSLVAGLVPGEHRFAVSSATLVRTSARSAWVTQEVT